jgi:hypothetical protein
MSSYQLGNIFKNNPLPLPSKHTPSFAQRFQSDQKHSHYQNLAHQQIMKIENQDDQIADEKLDLID